MAKAVNLGVRAFLSLAGWISNREYPAKAKPRAGGIDHNEGVKAFDPEREDTTRWRDDSAVSRFHNNRSQHGASRPTRLVAPQNSANNPMIGSAEGFLNSRTISPVGIWNSSAEQVELNPSQRSKPNPNWILFSSGLFTKRNGSCN